MEDRSSVLNNPLATQPVIGLILKFAIPAIISGLVSAFYNIVDQIFIGHVVGVIGNTATNVSFPLVTISMSIALLLGIGSASNFSLELGRGNNEKASKIVGTGISLMFLFGLLLCTVILIFRDKLLLLFGATDQSLIYAQDYTSITALGIPFFIFSIGGSHLVRADGSPKYAMAATLSGAILNIFLDALFMLVFDMGIRGAALATIIGQIISGSLNILYFIKYFKTVPLKREHFTLNPSLIGKIASLGAASCFNQLAMTAVQITMNNTLKTYGALSVYGSDIPIACVGIISKVNIIFMSIIIGTAQGCQPINGFNYGAKNYARVKETYKKALIIVTCISTVALICFQVFPRQIISIFGDGSEEYFAFATRYFRIYMLLTFINGVQPLTSSFFTSIGKAQLGILMSLTRQIIFLLPLIMIFPLFFGIDGVMYAGPIADGATLILTAILVIREMKKMNQLMLEAENA